MSLRSRLLLVSFLTLAAGMVALCVAGNVLLAHTVHQDARQQLSTRLDAIVASIAVSNGQITVNNTLNDSVLDPYAWIVRSDGHVLEAPAGAPSAVQRVVLQLARAAPSNEIRAPGGLILGSRLLHFHGHRLGTIVADFSTVTLESLRRRVLFGSTIVAILTLLVGVLAIRRALGAALTTVDQMTRDAENWGAHDLDRRFGLGPPRDEISALAATLDHLLERIAASRRHEQRFAAEVAHELRTPLSAIRGVAELAADAPDPEEARDALSQIEGHSRRIAATLDTLIAFARRESTPAAEGVDLEQIAAEFDDVIVKRFNGPLPRIDGDPAMIRQTLAPLIDNARRHAATHVTVELSRAPGLVFVAIRDDGHGVDPTLGTRVFLPGVRGDAEPREGAGLGLPLARRLARACGGEIILGPGPGGCFVLELPSPTDSGTAPR
jgi:signal transduction histidine kinase